MRRILRCTVLILASLILASSVLANHLPVASAQTTVSGKMVWVNRGNNTIYTAGLTGDNLTNVTPAAGNTDLNGIAIDETAGKMYYTSYGGYNIYRANLDGSEAENVNPGGASGPMGIQLDLAAEKMYFVTWGGAFYRANLDGTNLEYLAGGFNGLVGIDLDRLNRQAYLADYSGSAIYKVDLVTFSITNVSPSGTTRPEMIALDVANGKMYWAEFTGAVKRANLDGSAAETLVTSPYANGVTGIALDLANGKIYWTNTNLNSIDRANLDGSSPENVTPAGGGVNSPQAIALTGTITPPRTVSIVRAGASPTSANQVHFTVAFSEPVSGVDASDFALFTTGILSHTSIVEVAGGPQSFDVTVSTGIGTGTLRLDLMDDDSIINASQLPLGGSGQGNGSYVGETYEIQKRLLFLPLILNP